jgi:hypothetical protein
MTHEEFRTRVDAIFGRSPLVPAVLELIDGKQIIVDLPEQIEHQHGMLAIRRRTDPIVYRIGYDAISQVTPIDELPGETGGLSYANFYATVRPLLWHEPYQPFTLELRDGKKLVIERAGQLALAGRFGVYLPPNSAPFIRFTYDQVMRVTTSNLAQAG